ncbi:hypothetical protein E2P63_01590 [Candidatus Bathyarchaeota archaeon]|nr:hypothetical protein E2P63_01590 [Candidatus Bathyarchaeota archaeon]
MTAGFKINTSKLMVVIAIITFIIGVTAVLYSVTLFLANSRQPEEPTVLRVTQWSGYMVASDVKIDVKNRSSVVSSVSGSWVVPEVNPSENNTFSGIWVGIGGYGEGTLIQAGTEQEYVNGKAVYYAWYELVPDYLIRINGIHVKPTDIIKASINLVNEYTNTWTITIKDVTRNEQFKKTFIYNSSRLSAEWVVERPKVNGTVSTLADFKSVTFTECIATLDDVTGPIGNFSYAQFVMQEDDTPLVSVSLLDGGESGFTVGYLEQPSQITLANDSTQDIAAKTVAFSIDTKTVGSKMRPDFSVF